MNQRPCHLVDGSVASHRHNDVGVVVYTFLGNVGSVSRIFGEDHLVAVLRVVEGAVDEVGHVLLVLCAGMRVEYEYNTFLFLHRSAKILNFAQIRRNKWSKNA